MEHQDIQGLLDIQAIVESQGTVDTLDNQATVAHLAILVTQELVALLAIVE